MDIIKFFEATAEYAFKDRSLPKEALLAAGASTCRKDVEGDPRGNKRLALIGDALIRLELVDHWHTTGASPDTTQKVISQKASNQNLEKIGRDAGLARYIILHPAQKHVARTTLASAVEALVGAVWLDSSKDYATVRRVVRALNIDPTSR
ncbi:RNAse III [Apiospora kogelbergensis]|uniref:RNAse III n=1 Tax=Apiospora kogelbergensis TaxID=1337665 RepID=UPI00312F2E3B